MGDHPLTQLTGSVRKYSKGNIVFFQGEVPRNAFFVREGTVQVYAIDDEGDAYIVGFYGEGDIFPLDWLHDRSSATTFYFEALTPCELAPIEKAAYQEVSDEPAVKAYVQGQFIRESTSGLIRNLALQQARARDKIIYFFYFLAIRHGKELSSGLFSLGIPLTHQTIANCLGLTRETVATELGTLKRAGAVAYRNKKYVVDKKMVIKAVGKEIALD
ncbi:MAG TPA: Crp/Fnr family transcriptional regulator [Candidatus Saccharimonadales bacterium]|nr:Crp/Fnr family transcriptional regulator [Candidatus Saccharimonadales bacterium]